MSNTVKLVNSVEIQEAGTKALIKELGVTGMLRYLEQYDNGGSGDYTKEKYERENFSFDEILMLSPNADIDDIRNLREYKYHVTHPMTVCEKTEGYRATNGTLPEEPEEKRNHKSLEAEGNDSDSGK